MARILLTDPDPAMRTSAGDALQPDEHDVVHAASGEDALRELERRRFHVLITELRLPTMDGLTLIRRASVAQPNLACLVLTAHGTVETAVEAMKLGALEFLAKPLRDAAALRRAVAAAHERYRLRSQVERVTMSDALNAPQLTFGAPAMRPVVEAIKKVARTNATVLLLGESGTGKEVAARALHFWSARRQGPFVAINCAALTESLLESELFGHEKGAFSGAEKRRIGRIEQAQGGTFFLDEVGELKLDIQAKLLRVLQDRTIQRLGGNETLGVDVRWIAATNRDLEAAARQGHFREDLFHRLAVFPVMLPPLRERREDIVPLAEKLLFAIGCELGRLGLTLDDGAKAYLESADWAGNVRELRNVLERAAIVADGTKITADVVRSYPFHARSEAEPPARRRDAATEVEKAPGDGAAASTLRSSEREAIQRALLAHGGHRQKTADALGISLRALYDKLKKHKLT